MTAAEAPPAGDAFTREMQTGTLARDDVRPAPSAPLADDIP